ncbi:MULTISPECIES: hypothetical protein [Clostridium]|uniref:hypothetical protein n=1 Tax=Clostridium TaxID=1485 RepID=UPI00196769BB|nr:MULTISPECIES: hypothetical protein [Clostridium]MBN1062680.1 hypothetical protein [Clostridium botulinum]
MNKNFIATEKYIQSLFPIDSELNVAGLTLKVLGSGKPTCQSGEPKTDVYILLEDINDNKRYNITISVKKTNADFLENKISAERAECILGSDWINIIKKSTLQIKDEFLQRSLIYKQQKGKTRKGSITLGWKFELVNKPNGDLSGNILLTHDQIVDIYSGRSLPDDKKDALLYGKKIPNSGVAQFMLVGNISDFNIGQDVIDNLITVEDYAKKNPNIYFACKALNYRTFEKKFDGNRPLSVFVDWKIHDGKLSPSICFDYPLTTKGNEVAKKLCHVLNELNINTTDDITHLNVSSINYIY